MTDRAKKAVVRIDRLMLKELAAHSEEVCASGGKIGVYVSGLTREDAMAAGAFLKARGAPEGVKAQARVGQDPNRGVGFYRLVLEFTIEKDTSPGNVKA